ncbi:MAG: hypothetical protein HW416_3177 [Chloroflexi bacterium]|nr:hypothetical protein [Chloroflexota bacterium]
MMDEPAVEREVRSRFPEGAVQRVVFMRYGDDPAIEPGRVGIRLVIDPAKPVEGGPDALAAFHHVHEDAIRKLAGDLPKLLPEHSRLEFSDGDKSLFMIGFGGPDERPGELTPVMARLAPTDLETLDTLITAGIATSRADAVRWALARIRERPAYGQLSQRVREINELKAQF